jgi:hypothetical protein
MREDESFRWWDVRPAQNLEPKHYICPLCDQQLDAMSEHMLLLPEGDPSRRRHAHSDCVAQARRAGTLPTRDEWRDNRPASAGGRERRRRRKPGGT